MASNLNPNEEQRLDDWQKMRQALRQQPTPEQAIAEAYKRGPYVRTDDPVPALQQPAINQEATTDPNQLKSPTSPEQPISPSVTQGATTGTFQQQTTKQSAPAAPQTSATLPANNTLTQAGKSQKEQTTASGGQPTAQNAASLGKTVAALASKDPKAMLASANLSSLSQMAKGKQIDVIMYVFLSILMVFAILIDLINLLALGTVIDWIFDTLFFLAVLVMTFKGLDSFFIRRTITNFIGMVAEWIPVIDMLPFHILVVLIIWLDMKYDILDFASASKKIPGGVK